MLLFSAKDELHVFFLRWALLFSTEIWRIPAKVRLAPFILKVNLRLFQRRTEEVFRLHSDASTRWGTDAQPVQPQSVPTGNPVQPVECMRQTKCMDDVFAAQEAGVRSAMR